MTRGAGRDHGGGLDAAIARFGGARKDWIDLSTGINPEPYPIGAIEDGAWRDLPDQKATERLIALARRFWNVPDRAGVLAAPGASALIARLPAALSGSAVSIPAPTYNEHRAAFLAHGWAEDPTHYDVQVLVHPNNPDGQLHTITASADHLTVVDESFCDVAPQNSQVAQCVHPRLLVLKSFGKFWGLAGLLLGFVIGNPDILARLDDMLGPWPVSGPALAIATRALADTAWADATRARLQRDADRLDALLIGAGAKVAGGTMLFRLYHVDDAPAWQRRLARAHIWSRVFPYSKHWLRLGLPPAEGWDRLEATL